MKKLIVLSILCLAFTGCGSKETNTDNVTTETETQIEVETEVTENESQNLGNSNGTSGQMQFEKAEEIYCQYEDIEPITVYAIKEDSFYGDPNYFDNTLTVQGAYSQGVQYTFNQKTTYENIDYYAFTRADGLMLLAPVTDFSETPIETEVVEDDYEFKQMTDEEVKEAEEQAEEIRENMRDQGLSDEEINDVVGENGNGLMYITPDMVNEEVSNMTLEEVAATLTPEQLEMADGKQLY